MAEGEVLDDEAGKQFGVEVVNGDYFAALGVEPRAGQAVPGSASLPFS